MRDSGDCSKLEIHSIFNNLKGDLPVKNALKLVGLTIVMLGSTTQAANFYVDSTGGGVACTKLEPCSSIQNAVNIAGMNDSIFVSAGAYNENIEIPAGKDGLHIRGQGAGLTKVVSAGGLDGKFAPAGVPLDAVFDVFSPGTTISKLTIKHPTGVAVKRDIGVFVRPPAVGVEIEKSLIVRKRIGDVLEPTVPGSRGVFVIRAANVSINKNTFRGNYEDAIHIPAPGTEIIKNDIKGAPRLGIVIIQESADTDSTNNLIVKNTVVDSGSDGIQVQGDSNLIMKNTVTDSGGAGIKLCGQVAGDCVPPGDDAVASYNLVIKNTLSGNAVGDVVDNGNDNIITHE